MNDKLLQNCVELLKSNNPKNKANAIIIGYNTLGKDESFFLKYLLTPIVKDLNKFELEIGEYKIKIFNCYRSPNREALELAEKLLNKKSKFKKKIHLYKKNQIYEISRPLYFKESIIEELIDATLIIIETIITKSQSK